MLIQDPLLFFCPVVRMSTVLYAQDRWEISTGLCFDLNCFLNYIHTYTLYTHMLPIMYTLYSVGTFFLIPFLYNRRGRKQKTTYDKSCRFGSQSLEWTQWRLVGRVFATVCVNDKELYQVTSDRNLCIWFTKKSTFLYTVVLSIIYLYTTFWLRCYFFVLHCSK